MADDDVRFTLEIRMDATLSIKTGGDLTNWVKPGVSSSISWGYIPEDEQIKAAADTIRNQIVEPILDEVIQASAERIREIGG